MRVLGINISHNASIAQITDGKLDLYFEEDRFNKIKQGNPASFPDKRFISIDTHVTEKPDYVIFASSSRDIVTKQLHPNFISDETIISWFVKQLEEKFGEIQYLFMQEHHLYHAHSAFYFSKLTDAICIVMDGGGAPLDSNKQYREIESVYCIDKEICTPKYKAYTCTEFIYHRLNGIPIEDVYHTYTENNVDIEISSKCSSGMKFEIFAEENHTGQEIGKIMGLASYGNLTGDTLYDRANQLQEETVLNTFEIIDKAITYSDSKNIILSGGYALNCVNNYRYIKHFPEYNFFVDPAAHDGGTAIGAALWFYKEILKSEVEIV